MPGGWLCLRNGGKNRSSQWSADAVVIGAGHNGLLSRCAAGRRRRDAWCSKRSRNPVER